MWFDRDHIFAVREFPGILHKLKGHWMSPLNQGIGWLSPALPLKLSLVFFAVSLVEVGLHSRGGRYRQPYTTEPKRKRATLALWWRRRCNSILISSSPVSEAAILRK
ncbi:hypothetical protein BC936DRAFT_145366, partial [Jimgerdemannia flammicorona]